MKRILSVTAVLILTIIISTNTWSQKSSSGVATINRSDLESHLSFLASPLLKGRLNGSTELDITANYLASQAKKIGLKPAGGDSYYQYYTIVKKYLDPEKTSVAIYNQGIETVTIREPIYQIYPMGASDFQLDGEVVFAGYGIKADQLNYDDFDTVNMAGKIVLVMNRAPSGPDGKCRFGDEKWMGMNGLQMKLQALMFRKPKAIMFVSDPKSGHQSMDKAFPGVAEYLASSMSLKGKKSQAFEFPGIPKVMFVHSKVADVLLEGTGKTLAGLQNEIDTEMKSKAFLIPGKTVRITEASLSLEQELPNIAGIVEGRDPVLKNEVVIFSGHMDHVGGEGENIKPGADDNASGCAALLELAEAFMSLPKKPLRSVMFLWVSGEEVGLFGSESYVNNPLLPLENTVADINMDMIGRIKGVADTTKDTPMTGPAEVFLITDDQSKELVSLANASARKNNIDLDYSLSGKNHPLMLFARSDHFNFVKKDIPVLFFTTGLHTDYHKTGDTADKIDFAKMELITKTIFDTGYQVANMKNRITVDNPFSKWENNPFRNF